METPRKPAEPAQDWQKIAKQITEEKDGDEVIRLSEELVRALDKQKKGAGA